jgi:Zn-dependent M28 family amino/carboxypeptidase
VERERREGVNVVGVLPASAEPASRPWVIVGAHYDHLGTGAHGNSLAREGEQGALHPGADDNASGVAAVLRIGELLAREPARRRHVLLAFWSGEELGLLGSSAFGEGGFLAPEEIAACLNFDMVGRVREGRLALQAVGTSPDWPALVESASAGLGLDLELQEDPVLPTDSASFDRLDVPTLNFFSGGHADYHRPTDTPDRIEYEALERVARLGARIARELAARPEAPTFARVERRATPGAGRDSLRAWTGTVPDYVASAPGLALAAVAAGGPAALAGLRAGDVIVEFAGQRIANIYDYTYALDVARIGEPVRVVYLRDGERREALITPRER